MNIEYDIEIWHGRKILNISLKFDIQNKHGLLHWNDKGNKQGIRNWNRIWEANMEYEIEIGYRRQTWNITLK